MCVQAYFWLQYLILTQIWLLSLKLTLTFNRFCSITVDWIIIKLLIVPVFLIEPVTGIEMYCILETILLQVVLVNMCPVHGNHSILELHHHKLWPILFSFPICSISLMWFWKSPTSKCIVVWYFGGLLWTLFSLHAWFILDDFCHWTNFLFFHRCWWG